MHTQTTLTARQPADGGLSSSDLFDMDSVAMDSPRLAAIKAADIQTHHAPHMDEDPWLAIPMNDAREILDGYDLTKAEKSSIPDMMAGYCRLLDECGMIFYGQTEREAQDAALASLSNAGGMARELAAQDSDNSNDING